MNEENNYESIFDRLTNDQFANLWCPIPANFDPSNELLRYENRLFISTPELRSSQERYFMIYNNKLMYKKDKNSEKLLSCIILDYVHLYPLLYTNDTPDDNCPLGGSLSPGGDNTSAHKRLSGYNKGFRQTRAGSIYDFWITDQQDISYWIGTLRPLVINTDFHLRFEKVIKLEDGGFSSVYTFIDRFSQITYAVKCINKKPILESMHRQKQLVNELTILRLVSHRNIVKFYEFHETSNSFYFIMEYCLGPTLENTLVDPTDLNTIQNIQNPILKALAYCEGLKIVHRDIKPGNQIWRLNDFPPAMNELVLIDFGLSFFEYEALQLYEGGTVGYIAPEGFASNNKKRVTLSTKIDVYSVGCIFYAYLAKTEAFAGHTFQEIYDNNQIGYIDLSKINGIEDDAPIELLKKMIEPNFAKRSTASQIISDKFILGSMYNNFYSKRNNDDNNNWFSLSVSYKHFKSVESCVSVGHDNSTQKLKVCNYINKEMIQSDVQNSKVASFWNGEEDRSSQARDFYESMAILSHKNFSKDSNFNQLSYKIPETSVHGKLKVNYSRKHDQSDIEQHSKAFSFGSCVENSNFIGKFGNELKEKKNNQKIVNSVKYGDFEELGNGTDGDSNKNISLYYGADNGTDKLRRNSDKKIYTKKVGFKSMTRKETSSDKNVANRNSDKNTTPKNYNEGGSDRSFLTIKSSTGGFANSITKKPSQNPKEDTISFGSQTEPNFESNKEKDGELYTIKENNGISAEELDNSYISNDEQILSSESKHLQKVTINISNDICYQNVSLNDDNDPNDDDIPFEYFNDKTKKKPQNESDIIKDTIKFASEEDLVKGKDDIIDNSQMSEKDMFQMNKEPKFDFGKVKGNVVGILMDEELILKQNERLVEDSGISEYNREEMKKVYTIRLGDKNCMKLMKGSKRAEPR